MKISLIFILLMAACTTEPVEIHDDNAVLHTLLNMGTGTIEIKDCVDLPDSICVWEDDRITQLNLFNMELSGTIPDEIDYSMDDSHRNTFLTHINRYLNLPEDALTEDFTGIRPKIQAPGEPSQDFIIVNEKEKGYDNFINLIGIESPGLTAALAIAEYMKDIID